MKAVVNTRYGSPDVLEIREVPKPEPKPGEVLVRVNATTVSRTDCGNLRPLPPVLGRLMMGLFRPKHSILGMDFAGTVEVLGKGVASFGPGDRVSALLLASGRLQQLGALGAGVFFLAILPLGVGSAFPFPLIAIAALAVMTRQATREPGQRAVSYN